MTHLSIGRPIARCVSTTNSTTTLFVVAAACYLRPGRSVMEDMKRFTVTLAGLVLVGGLALVVSTVSSGVGAYGPVYTVSALRARLADNPHAWLAHTVLVRGVALGSP